MKLLDFVTSLFGDGRIRVGQSIRHDGSPMIPSSAEIDSVTAALLAFETDYRQQLAEVPPVVDPPSMIWAALMIFRASSAIVHRGEDPAVVNRLLSEPCIAQPSPQVCYSVDLTMRFLPDLIRLAKAAASNDPIIESLNKLAHDWPLSSVGIADIGSLDVKPFMNNPCLASLYVDRIIATKDRSRLDDPDVCDEVRAAIGIHFDLVPEFASVFAEQQMKLDPGPGADAPADNHHQKLGN